MMDTSIFNGETISRMPWDYMVTIHKCEKMTPKKWEKDIISIGNSDNRYFQIYHCSEKISNSIGMYHNHQLVDCNGNMDELDILDFYKRYIGKGKEISYKSKYTVSVGANDPIEIDGKFIKYDLKTNRNLRKIEFKENKTLTNGKEILVKPVITKLYIPFYEIYGTEGRVYIEKVQGVKNVSYYTNKFTNRGLTTNYWNRNLKSDT
jgi:hypothetical protein